jgi:hypothetical protein
MQGNRPRKNSLDEMTVRRTEVPVDGPRPRKPPLDNMGPGTDRETPIPTSRPHKPSLKETHAAPEVPFAPEERPRPRSFGGKPGSNAGKKGRW